MNSRRLVSQRMLLTLLVGVLVVTAACLPKNLSIPGLQSFAVHFKTLRGISADQYFDVNTVVLPNSLRTLNQFARLSGILTPPEGRQLPASVEVKAIFENAETGKALYTFRVSVPVAEDGSFSATRRFTRNFPGGTRFRTQVRPVGQAIYSGTEINLCLDMALRRAELDEVADCSGRQDEPQQPPAGDENNAPIASVVANPGSIPSGDNHRTVVTIDGSGSIDPDGDALSYSWTVPSGRFVNGTTASDATIQVTFPGAAPYRVTLQVEDGRGGSDSAEVVVGLTTSSDGYLASGQQSR